MVSVVPLTSGHATYDFLPESAVCLSRVAVNKVNGLVCLSYTGIAKISIHTEDGTFIKVYDWKRLALSELFTPWDVCFDNENFIIIADRGGLTPTSVGQVLRVNI